MSFWKNNIHVMVILYITSMILETIVQWQKTIYKILRVTKTTKEEPKKRPDSEIAKTKKM